VVTVLVRMNRRVRFISQIYITTQAAARKLSLLTRIIGVALCLAAGWMMGYVQGLQSIVDAATNLAFQVAGTIPNALPSEAIVVANSFAAYVQGDFNPARNAYWEFGIVIAFVGFILIARGDPTPEPESEPLLPPGYYENKK